MLSKQALIRNHLVAIREAMKSCPEVLMVRGDDDEESPRIFLEKPEDVRAWADEAGVPLSVGDRWDEVYADIDGVTVYAFGEW